MIRRSQLLQSGVVVEDGPTLDEIHEEEKAAAAAAEVEDVDVLAAAEASADLSEVGNALMMKSRKKNLLSKKMRGLRQRMFRMSSPVNPPMTPISIMSQ